MTNETTSATADNDNEATLASGLGGLPASELDSVYLAHLKAVDIPAWYHGRGDWFTCQLFALMSKADDNNFRLLAEAFHTEGQAFVWWKEGGLAAREDTP